jgi:hypothetical protein
MKIYKEVGQFGNIDYRNEKGQLHREDGAAREHRDGYKAWYINGKRHRTDGPAREWMDGRKEWWINDKQLMEEEFNRKITKLYKLLYT